MKGGPCGGRREAPLFISFVLYRAVAAVAAAAAQAAAAAAQAAAAAAAVAAAAAAAEPSTAGSELQRKFFLSEGRHEAEGIGTPLFLPVSSFSSLSFSLYFSSSSAVYLLRLLSFLLFSSPQWLRTCGGLHPFRWLSVRCYVR